MAEKKIKNQNVFGNAPHNPEAERAVLGCIMMDSIIQGEVVSALREDDFFSDANKRIFAAMEKIIAANQTVDLVTLSDALEKSGEMESVGGIDYITDLCSVMPSSANYERYLDIVKRDSTLRKLIKGAAEIIDDCSQSTDGGKSLALAEKTVFDVSSQTDTSEVVKISSVIPDVMIRFDEISRDKNAYKGIRTTFRDLDNLLNGLHKSDLMVLAARPGMGKTSLAMNIVENVAMQGYSCAVFSLEMGKEQLVQRMLCSVAGVSMENALKGKMNKLEWQKMEMAKQKIAETNIFIDDSALITPMEIVSKCRRIKRRYGLDLVMIDYIQLMNSSSSRKDDNRQQQVAEISRSLKMLAKELQVPVLALSQLSRRAVDDKNGGKKIMRPQLSDLRESGAIEQDADIVIFIHRPDKARRDGTDDGTTRKNVAEIIVEKHRNGPTGIVELYFKGECTKFINISDDEAQEAIKRQESQHSEEGGDAEYAAPEDNQDFDQPFPDEKDAPAEDEDIFG